jgi:hypothetical protein
MNKSPSVRKYFATLELQFAMRREGVPITGQGAGSAAKNFVQKHAPPMLPMLRRQSRNVRVYLWRALEPADLLAVDVMSTTITKSVKRKPVVDVQSISRI